MKSSSVSLVIKEVQIKTVMKYHLRPVRIAISNKTKDNKFWQGSGEQRTLFTVGVLHSLDLLKE